MTRLWTSGFELQSVATGVEFSTVTNSPTISTSIARNGGSSLRCNPSNSAQFIRHQYATITSGRRIFTRFYMYIASMPITNDVLIWCNPDSAVSGGTPGRTPRLFLKTTGTLGIAEGSGTTHTYKGTESATLNTGQWYRIEVDYNGPSSDATTCYLDGVNWSGTVQGGDGTWNTTGALQIGAATDAQGTAGSATCDLYFDDIAINDSTGSFQNGLPGAGSVVHLRPNAAGDANDFVTTVGGTAGAANNYTRVNEVTPNDATSYNLTTLSLTTTVDDFNITNSASAGIGPSDTISLVSVGTRIGSNNITAASLVYRLKSQAGGTVVESPSVNVNINGWGTHTSTAPFVYQLTSYTNPQSSGSPWTPALLDTAQIGYRANASMTTQRRVSTIWALVEFVPSTGTDYTNSFGDTEGLTDTSSVIMQYGSSATDTEGITDILGTTEQYNSSISDSEGLADNLALSTTGITTVAEDTLGLSDNTLLGLTHPEILGDAEGLTDNVSLANLITPGTLSDPVGLTDEQDLTITLGELPADTEGITEDISFAQEEIDLLENLLGLSDEVFFFDPNDQPEYNEFIGLTDEMILGVSTGQTFSEALALSDSLSWVLSQGYNLSDTEGTTDFISLVLKYWKEDHVPHSSPGFGEIYIDRFFLIEREEATETNDGGLSLAGQESSPPTTVPLVTFLHGQVAGMQEGKLIPVIFRDKAERNAYYAIGKTSSKLTDYQGEVAMADWTIELDRQGSAAEIDIQSRLTGAIRQNDFSLTGTRWHAPAIGHYAYYTGTSTPSPVQRATSDGDIDVYLSIPANTHPKWGCAVEDYHAGRVRITDTREVSIENEVEGLNRNISASGWSLMNGILNITPSSSAGVVNVAYWNGTSFIDSYWKIQVAGNNVAAWDTATILRNDYEQGIIRLTATSTTGRVSLDLGLRRGSLFVEGYLQNSTSATLKVVSNTTMSSTSATAGTVVESSGTNKRVIGSARTFVPDNSNGGLSKASTVSLDFWIGTQLNGGTGNGGTATNMRDQYIATMPEYSYGVRR